MAARLRPRHQEEIKAKIEWKYYVYQFFSNEICIYVGKGSNNRFKTQQKRFNQFHGKIIAYFKAEKDALAFERGLILSLAPSHNISCNPETPEPWKYSLVPINDCDFIAWCEMLGTRQMAARVLLAKPWSYLTKNNIKIKELVSKVDNYLGVYHGQRC